MERQEVQRSASRRSMEKLAARMLWGTGEGGEWYKLGFADLDRMRDNLVAEDYGPGTVNKILSMVRGRLKREWAEGRMTRDEYERARSAKDLEYARGRAGRMVEAGEIAQLAAGIPDDAAGLRDRAMVSVLQDCGLRRAELRGLDMGDVEWGEHRIHVRHGKGDSERRVVMSDGTEAALMEWLRVRGIGPGPLFCRITRTGAVLGREGKGLSGQAVLGALARRQRETGVASFTAHDLRRTFITGWLDRGADLSTVAYMAGHKNVNTTAGYDRGAERRAFRLVRGDNRDERRIDRWTSRG